MRFLILLSVVLATSASAETLHLCVAGSGRVRATETAGLCKAGREVYVAVPLALPASPALLPVVGVTTTGALSGYYGPGLDACRADFGPDARPCTEAEVRADFDTARAASFDSTVPGNAWVSAFDLEHTQCRMFNANGYFNVRSCSTSTYSALCCAP